MYTCYWQPVVKMNTESNQGKSCFVYKDNKFREYYRNKKGNVCFRCTVKTCKSRTETIRVVKSMTKQHVHNHVHHARRGHFFSHKKDDLASLSLYHLWSTSIKILVSITRRPNPNCFKIDRCVALLEIRVAVLLILHLRFCCIISGMKSRKRKLKPRIKPSFHKSIHLRRGWVLLSWSDDTS